MSADNPSIKASDIISDVENRLGNPNLSTSIYLPWVSYGYMKTYAALAKAGQSVKETLFGNYVTFTLANGTAEYALSTYVSRFGSLIKAEILYGGTGDIRTRAAQLRSIAEWLNQGNVSTSYRDKSQPLVYFLQDKIGFIPTPPSSDAAQATAYIWYVKRPFQVTDGTDVIDIPYRFIYPLVNYVQAKAIQKYNEDYTEAALVEKRFDNELEEIALAADSEFNENDGNAVEISSSSALYDNPFR
jgi:hypothetical protein